MKSQDLGNARNPYADMYRDHDNHTTHGISPVMFTEVDFLNILLHV